MADYDADDMEAVGRALMETLQNNADALKGWAPAQCPSEIVADLLNNRAPLESRLAEAERERDNWKVRAQVAEPKYNEWFEEALRLQTKTKSLTAALEQAKEGLEKLIRASSRLSVAAQTTGGVAGRDEVLCAEIDRIAQPLGGARATLAQIEAALKENGK